MSWDCLGFIDAVLSPCNGLTASQRLVAVAMARRGERCWSSNSTLGKQIGLSARSVGDQIKGLEQAGWLKLDEGGRGRTNVWILVIPDMNEVPHPRNEVPTPRNEIPTPTYEAGSEGYERGSEGYETVSGGVGNSFLQKSPMKESIKESSKEWEAPTWFLPLTQLSGYKHENHSAAANAIRAGCEAAGVSVGQVVEDFATYWPRGSLPRSQGGHSWKNPVKTLVNTLDVQIGKTQQSMRRNGKPADKQIAGGW